MRRPCPHGRHPPWASCAHVAIRSAAASAVPDAADLVFSPWFTCHPYKYYAVDRNHEALMVAIT